ncbi:MAG: YidC/Oxa1 family membrane protein insertase [Clostridiales bacterium]|nr:YidC/Oxa1 family membrane protein insertase [Clostridiales bacterium]
MDIWQILMTPFSLLLKMLCQVFNSYGIALFLFTVIIKIILFPLNLKGKKSMIKMNVVNGQLKEIQQRCGNDKERYNQEVQKFYTENNVSPFGGCGWSMIPLFILWPLYAIIRRPLKYMMSLTEQATVAVADALGWTAKMGSQFNVASSNELVLGAMIEAGNLESAKAAATAAGVSAAGMFVINFNFFGIDLSKTPQLRFWEGGLSWGSVGLFLLPVISAGLSLLTMMVTQKTNQMNKDQDAPKMNLSMMLMGPVMSLWIGFALPAGMCVYWIANSLLGMVQEVICGRMLRKDYEAAQAEMAAQAAKAKEAEKERRRIAAEKKAAAIAAGKDPKKAHQKNKNKDKEKGVDVSASREGLRAYARGRAYDPNRYPITPYVDPNGPAKPVEEEPKELTEEEKKILAESNRALLDQAEAAAEKAKAAEAAGSDEAPAGEETDEGDYEEAYAEDNEEQ